MEIFSCKYCQERLKESSSSIVWPANKNNNKKSFPPTPKLINTRLKYKHKHKQKILFCCCCFLFCIYLTCTLLIQKNENAKELQEEENLIEFFILFVQLTYFFLSIYISSLVVETKKYEYFSYAAGWTYTKQKTTTTS